MGKPKNSAPSPSSANTSSQFVKDDEGNYVDRVTGRYPKGSDGKEIVTGDIILASGTKQPKGQGAKEWFTNIDNIKGLAEAAVGLGTGIAGAVKKPKGQNEGGGGGGGEYTPTNPDLILGMSKPIFFGLVGGVVLIAGVGIFFAVRGSGDASASAPAAK